MPNVALAGLILFHIVRGRQPLQLHYTHCRYYQYYLMKQMVNLTLFQRQKLASLSL